MNCFGLPPAWRSISLIPWPMQLSMRREKRGLVHQEMHSRVDYIVAHGIATYVGDERVVIGSHHFVFEDEGCRIRRTGRQQFEGLSTEYSHLYLAIGGMLAAVICIEDPLREEARK